MTTSLNSPARGVSRRATCSKCGRTKPATEFHRYRPNRSGLQSQCKECHREAALASYHRAMQDPQRREARRRWERERYKRTKGA